MLQEQNKTSENTITEMVVAPGVSVTNAAAEKVLSLVNEENNPNLRLRVYIEGGGCSGFQYGFTFDDETKEGDSIVQHAVSTAPHTDSIKNDATTVEFVIDPMSFQYLVGAEIDYKDDIDGERFIIRNPNASTTCGCGSSFSI